MSRRDLYDVDIEADSPWRWDDLVVLAIGVGVIVGCLLEWI